MTPTAARLGVDLARGERETLAMKLARERHERKAQASCGTRHLGNDALEAS